jgi:hypothetical protein
MRGFLAICGTKHWRVFRDNTLWDNTFWGDMSQMGLACRIRPLTLWVLQGLIVRLRCPKRKASGLKRE